MRIFPLLLAKLLLILSSRQQTSAQDEPTPFPTMTPTLQPPPSYTVAPTSSPTAAVGVASSPFDRLQPILQPTFEPASSPTSSPASSPTSSPVSSPTTSPASSPTSFPASSPTSFPASSPTSSPANSPTSSPASSPTSSPYSAPSPVSNPPARMTSGDALMPTSPPSSDIEVAFSHVPPQSGAEKDFCVVWEGVRFRDGEEFDDRGVWRLPSGAFVLTARQQVDLDSIMPVSSATECCDACLSDFECEMAALVFIGELICLRLQFQPTDPLNSVDPNSEEVHSAVVGQMNYSMVWKVGVPSTATATPVPVKSATLVPVPSATPVPIPSATLVPAPSSNVVSTGAAGLGPVRPSNDDNAGDPALATTLDPVAFVIISGDTALTTILDRVAFTIIGGTALLCLLLYAASRLVERRELRSMGDDANGASWSHATMMPTDHNRIFFVGLAIADVVSDVFFTANLLLAPRNDAGYFALAFLGGPFVVNVILLMKTMRTEFGNQAMREWYSRNSLTGTAVFILACTNIEVVGLLHSRIFGCRIEGDLLFAPISIATQKNLFFYGLINNVLEDVPQLIIQLWVLNLDGSGAATAILIVALSTSTLGIFFGIFRRLCFVLAIHEEKSAAASASAASSVAASQCRTAEFDKNSVDMSRPGSPFSDISSLSVNMHTPRGPSGIDQVATHVPAKQHMIQNGLETLKIEVDKQACMPPPSRNMLSPSPTTSLRKQLPGLFLPMPTSELSVVRPPSPSLSRKRPPTLFSAMPTAEPSVVRPPSLLASVPDIAATSRRNLTSSLGQP